MEVYISRLKRWVKTLAIPALVAILVAGNVVAFSNLTKTSEELEAQKSISTEIKKSHKETSEELERVTKDKERQLAEKQQEANSLKEENERLKARKQARLQAQEAQKARTVSMPATVAITGDKQSWLAASGIPESEWHHVDFIVNRESSWNPNAVNPTSGACGLGQQLPCGKWAGAWNDPVAALRAQYQYVKARYGGYAQAVAFWHSNRWY